MTQKNDSPSKAPASKRAPAPTRLSAPFWAAADEGRLLVQRDPASGATQFFPRPVNLASAAPTEWVASDGEGTLLAFTECHVPAKGFDAELPYVLGVVRLEGGARVFAQVVGVDAASLAVGQRMRLRWLARDAGPQVFAFEPVPQEEMPS
jgi:uncharacterized OB-fold protein